MTPMIDVVFLLIIFFLVSSHLAQRENRIPVNLPQASSGQQDLPSVTPRLTITIRDDGSIWLGGRRIESKEVRARLVERQQQEGPDLEVRIRCDRHVPYSSVEPILADAARADIWNVTFAVIQRPEA
jgi:biopolymer transport protein ExbD